MEAWEGAAVELKELHNNMFIWNMIRIIITATLFTKKVPSALTGAYYAPVNSYLGYYRQLEYIYNF